MLVTLGEEGVEGFLAGVAAGTVAAVVARAIASVSVAFKPALRAMDVATWATSSAWVSRVRW